MPVPDDAVAAVLDEPDIIPPAQAESSVAVAAAANVSFWVEHFMRISCGILVDGSRVEADRPD
jgi:hypothetical protein